MIVPTDLFDRSVVASVAGLVGFGGAMGGLVMNLAVGRLLDLGFGYQTVFSVVGTLHVIGFCVILLTIRQIVHCRRPSWNSPRTDPFGNADYRYRTTVADSTIGFGIRLALQKMMPRSSVAKNRSPDAGSTGSAIAKNELAGFAFEPLQVAAAVLTSFTLLAAFFATVIL